MDEPVIVTREIDVERAAEDLWPLVGEGEGWAEWLAPEVDVEVAEGATGTLTDDDGLRRAVRIDAVVPERSVRFTWWPAAEPDAVSTVELVVVPGDAGSRLRITEIQAAAGDVGSVDPGRGATWDWRVMALWVAATAVARV